MLKSEHESLSRDAELHALWMRLLLEPDASPVARCLWPTGGRRRSHEMQATGVKACLAIGHSCCHIILHMLSGLVGLESPVV